MRFTVEDAPDFRASITVLCKRAGTVPAGWRHAFDDAMLAFSAVDCPRRHDIVLRGPFVDDICLTVEIKGTDSVVQGISRRLLNRTAQTCERCARPGRLRTLATREVVVLCPTCAAPRLLRAELMQLLGEVKRADDYLAPRVWWYDQVALQLRPAIPRNAWRLESVDPASPDRHFVSDSVLRRLKPTFELLHTKLTKLLAENEPA